MARRKGKSLSVGADPNGMVFERNGHILRHLTEDREFYRQIVNDRPLIARLSEFGLVDTWIASSSSTKELTLGHRKIDFTSYYLEWSFDMLKDAALLTLHLTDELRKTGRDLKDAHPYNILFDYSKPVFVDFTSIVPAGAPCHGWLRGFMGEFLLPLFLLSRGWKRLNAWYFYLEDRPDKKITLTRFLLRCLQAIGLMPSEKGRARSVNRLSRIVGSLGLKAYRTRWEDYYRKGEAIVFDKPSTHTKKEESALRFLRKIRARRPQTLLDIASNEGWFSFAANHMGYSVVAFDHDERSINNLYLKIRGTNAGILPIVMDFKNPTRAHGPHSRWTGAWDRFRSDVTLSMAILHHLCLRQGVSFEVFGDTIAELTKGYAIVEFIGRDDDHIGKWLEGNDWYTEENFLKAMGRYFRQIQRLPSNPPSRVIWLFKRK